MKQAQFSFTLYFGAGQEGERYAKMVEIGRKRHGFRSSREYILYCLDEIAKKEDRRSAKLKVAA